MGNFNLGGGGGAALPIVRRCPVGYVTVCNEIRLRRTKLLSRASLGFVQ